MKFITNLLFLLELSVNIRLYHLQFAEEIFCLDGSKPFRGDWFEVRRKADSIRKFRTFEMRKEPDGTEYAGSNKHRSRYAFDERDRGNDRKMAEKKQEKNAGR